MSLRHPQIYVNIMHCVLNCCQINYGKIKLLKNIYIKFSYDPESPHIIFIEDFIFIHTNTQESHELATHDRTRMLPEAMAAIKSSHTICRELINIYFTQVVISEKSTVEGAFDFILSPMEHTRINR
jgi:hypothetical protein